MSYDIKSSTEPSSWAPARTGEYRGPCSNPNCDQTGADWYSRGSCLYYCDACARHINEQCLASGKRKACELHF